LPKYPNRSSPKAISGTCWKKS